jgi:hypothetical protein
MHLRFGSRSTGYEDNWNINSKPRLANQRVTDSEMKLFKAKKTIYKNLPEAPRL